MDLFLALVGSAAGGDVNAVGDSDRTLLRQTAEAGQENMVSLLLDRGADVNTQESEYGFTALHFAARYGLKPVADVLLRRGAEDR